MKGPIITAHVGLGSNLGDRRQQITDALQALHAHPQIALLAVSSYYQSEPWGVTRQPQFLNAVAAIQTGLDAPELLTVMKQLESDLGREPGSERWGPRAIDLDLLLFGDQVFQRPDLTVPHPRLHQRAFVLIPLLELQADLEIPGRQTAAAALEKLDQQETDGVVRYAEAPRVSDLAVQE